MAAHCPEGGIDLLRRTPRAMTKSPVGAEKPWPRYKTGFPPPPVRARKAKLSKTRRSGPGRLVCEWWRRRALGVVSRAPAHHKACPALPGSPPCGPGSRAVRWSGTRAQCRPPGAGEADEDVPEGLLRPSAALVELGAARRARRPCAASPNLAAPPAGANSRGLLWWQVMTAEADKQRITVSVSSHRCLRLEARHVIRLGHCCMRPLPSRI